MRRIATLAFLITSAWLALGGSAAADTVQLVAGCQIVSLAAYPEGDALLNVTTDVDGGSPRLWFLTPGTSEFSLFDPRSAERSSKTALGAGDEAAFLCVDADVSWDRGRSAGAVIPTPTPGTAEPTATPGTAEPTPTPGAPTPTSVPAAGFSVRGVTTYLDPTDVFHLVGEVKNDSGSNARSVRINAQFFDAQGAPAGTGVGFSCLDIVPRGGDSPFDLFLFDLPPPEATYSLQVEAQPTSESPPEGLTESDVTERIDATGQYRLTGKVTNNSSVTYSRVVVCVALYDADGNVIRASVAFPDPNTLGPGESGEFQYFEPGVQPASHRLWMDASTE